MYKWTVEEISEHAWIACSCGYNSSSPELRMMYRDIELQDQLDMFKAIDAIYWVMEISDVLTIEDDYDTYKMFRFGASKKKIEKELHVKYLPSGKVDYAYGYVEQAFESFLKYEKSTILVVKVK